jgi:hypothetical protein
MTANFWHSIQPFVCVLCLMHNVYDWGELEWPRKETEIVGTRGGPGPFREACPPVAHRAVPAEATCLPPVMNGDDQSRKLGSVCPINPPWKQPPVFCSSVTQSVDRVPFVGLDGRLIGIRRWSHPISLNVILISFHQLQGLPSRPFLSGFTRSICIWDRWCVLRLNVRSFPLFRIQPVAIFCRVYLTTFSVTKVI